MVIQQQPSILSDRPKGSSMVKSRRRSVSPAEPSYRLAQALVKQEKWQEAIAAYQQALIITPNWVEVQRELGDLFLKLERWDEAVQVYETAISLRSESAEVYHNLGDALLKLQRWEDAIAAYEKAIELNPEFSWSYNNLGDGLRELQRWDEAAQAYGKAIELKPDFALSHHNLGDILVKKEDWEGAIAAYQKAVDLDPNFVWSYYNLGDVLVRIKDWENAIAAYRSAVKLDPNLPQVHEKLGDALRHHSQIDSKEISQVYHRAVEQNPTDLQVYYKALEVNPQDAEMSLKLADTLRNQGKLEQAITFYRSTLQIDPNNPEIQAVAWQKLGDVLRHLRHFEEAAKSYHQLVELKPEWAGSHFNLIRVLRQLGRLQEAQKAGVQAVEIEPRLANFYRNWGVIKGDILAVDTAYQIGERPKVAVCSWELAHNPAGRAYTLAQLYQAIADVEIIGSIFPKYGRELWEPIRKISIPCHSFTVEDEGLFLEQAMNLVLTHPYDIVHLSKPRMPNILFGLLYKMVWDARVIVDIDDEELAFVKAETAIELEDFLKSQGQLPELKNLTGKKWTQIAVGLVKEFDAVTVSNPALKQLYGGQIIRHARDEKHFQPSSERRSQSRERLGISQDKKVVLFFGTPREHKGLAATAEALATLGRQDVVFVIVGDFPDPSLKAKLQAIQGVNYLFLGNQPFDEIPDVLAVGDVCVLLQDGESPVSRFQIPAKLSDALGMGLTVLMSESVAVKDIVDSGAVIRVTEQDLGAALSRVLSDEAETQRLGSKAIELFAKEFSYAKNGSMLGLVLGSVMGGSTRQGLLSDRLNLLLEGLPSVSSILPGWGEQKIQSKALPKVEQGVSVIVLSLNGAALLDRLLSTFFAANTYFPVELIIIDHGSEDNTAEVVVNQAVKGDVRYVNLGENFSFSDSSNYGAGLAKYPHLLFLNNDIVFTEDVLPLAVGKLDNSGIGAVGVRLDDNPSSLPQGKEAGVQHTGIKFVWNENRGYFQPEQIRHGSLKDYLAQKGRDDFFPAVTGAFLLCRKMDFDRLGGFSRNYDYGLEDIDFCLRLGRDLQKKCYCINQVSLQHLEGATRKQGNGQIREQIIEKNHRLFKSLWDKYIHEFLDKPEYATEKLQHSTIRGFVDEFLEGYIWGWAKDINDDNKHLSISFYIDNNKINFCPANSHRADLEKAGIGSGNYGFKFAVPDRWLDGKEHIIEIRLNNNGYDTPITDGIPKKSLLLPEKLNFTNLPWRYTGSALNRSVSDCYFRVVFVSHMSNMSGAPIALLSLVKEMSKRPDFDCRVILNEDGLLAAEFARFAPTVFLHDLQTDGTSRLDALQTLASYVAQEDRRTVAICNTIATSDYIQAFASCNVPVLPWLHELPTSIDEFNGGQLTIDKICEVSPTIITPADMVRQALIDHYNLRPAKVVRHYCGTYAARESFSREESRMMVRAEFSLPNNALIVLGCGTFDARKGGDLFVSVAKRTLEKAPSNVWFIWVGDAYDQRFAGWCRHDARILGLGDRIILAGLRSNTAPYFQGADIFALTSREDPFPFVNMEAMAYGLPVLAFEGGGGAPEALREGRGIVVPYLDVNGMGDAINSLLSDKTGRLEIGERAATYMRDCFKWSGFADNIVEELRQRYGYWPQTNLSVSVIIPNYNHAEYLPQRIESILNQTRLPDEIFFLDDASEDDSVAIAKQYAAQSPIPFTIVENEVNSGSTFKQWLKGFSLVTGDLVWIAESDDWCKTDFLERLIPEFYDEDVKLAFCQSAIAGATGEIYAPNYTGYTDEISRTRWLSHYSISSAKEIAVALSQKNTIPNASAVLFRRPELREVTLSLLKYRLCGDWWFYLWRIQDGKISFIPKSLNYHRRHPKTVTHNIEKENRSIEEALLVKAELFDRECLPHNSICRSLAWTIYEYNRLSRLHSLDLSEMMENPDMAGVLSRIRRNFEPISRNGGIRVLIILPDMEVGGAQIAAIRLANAMAVDNTVFLVNARPDCYDSSLEERIDSRVLFLEGTLGPSLWATDREQGAPTHNNLAEGQARLSVLINLAKFHQIEIIHTHVWWADRLGFGLSQAMKIPWVIHMHGCYEDLIYNPTIDTEFSKLLAPLMQTVAGVIYGSTKNLEVFERHPEFKLPKLVKIFNGFDASQVPDMKFHSSPKQKGIMKFCLCSRAIPEKGWEQAIKAVLNINCLPAEERGYRKAHLALIGGGDFADTLRDRFNSKDCLEFHGQMTQPVNVIKDCDVGLLPSYFISETVPSTVIEYLVCGLPVIATDVGSIPEMLRVGHIEAGLVLPIGPARTINVDMLTSLLLRYMIDDKLFHLHRENTSKVFTSLFDMNKIRNDTVVFYKSLTFKV